MQQTKAEAPSYTELDEWKSMQAFLESHPQFQEGQMRWLLRHRKRNGLDDAVRKLGRSIYIHQGLFAQWILKKDG